MEYPNASLISPRGKRCPPPPSSQLTVCLLLFRALKAMSEHTPVGSTQAFMEAQLAKTTLERIEKASSLSFIRYHPRVEPEARNASEASTPTSAGDEDGQNVPSKTHTDTGLITLILCNDVPGLQVKPHQGDEFLNVEELYAPHDHLFIIIGQKMSLFALNSPSAFQPTVHKVSIPYRVQRHSLLYFVSV